MRTGLLAKGVVAVATTVLLVSGCSKRTSSRRLPASPATAGVSTAPSPSSVGDKEALAAYRAMMGDLVAVSRNPDENDARLRSHASANALALLRYMMKQDREKNVVAKGHVRVDPTILKSSASQVVLRDCADDSDWLLYSRDGKLENNVPGGRRRIDATLEKRDGGWRVERLYFDEVGTC